MTSHEMPQNTTLWERVGRFFLDWIKSLGSYAAVVSAGTLLFLVGSSIVGYLAYSDRPGPSWGRGVFSWGEVKFFVGWLPLLIYSLLYLGASLFPFARLLGWFRSPRWLLRVFGGLFAGIAALVAVLAAGWYIAISQYPAFAGAVSGMIYGAVLLPLFSRVPQSGPTSWKHWTGTAATIIACGAIVAYPLLPKQTGQSLEVIYVRVVPGPGDLASDAKGGGLTPDELKLLKSLGLTGTIHFGMSEFHGSTPAEARAVIVFTGELHSRAELREPLRTQVVYVEEKDGWKMYPPNAPTIRNKIKFWPSTKDPTKVEVQSDPAIGQPNALSWSPPLHDPR
jgi:hypothetical protein